MTRISVPAYKVSQRLLAAVVGCFAIGGVFAQAPTGTGSAGKAFSVTQAWVHTCLQQPSTFIAHSQCEDLVHSVHPDVVKHIVNAATQRRSVDTASKALWLLGQRREIGQWDVLVRASKDKDETIRLAAVQATLEFEMPPPEGARALWVGLLADVSILTDAPGPVAMAALRGLIKIGLPEDVPVMVEAINNLSFNHRMELLSGIEVRDQPWVKPIWRNLLSDSNPRVQAMAMHKLGVSGDDGNLDRMLPLLKDESPQMQAQAVLLIGRIGTETATKALRGFWDSKCPAPKSSLCAILDLELSALGDRLAQGRISKRLEGSGLLDGQEFVNFVATQEHFWNAGRGLKDPHVLQAVLTWMDKRSSRKAKNTEVVLDEVGRLKLVAATPTLVRWLSDPSPGVRLDALSALGAFQDVKHAGLIAGRLSDMDPMVRKKAAALLARLPGPDTLTWLTQARQKAKDPREQKQLDVYRARLGERALLTDMRKMALNPQSGFQLDGIVALGFIGNPAVADELVSIYLDSQTDADFKHPLLVSWARQGGLEGQRSDLMLDAIKRNRAKRLAVLEHTPRVSPRLVTLIDQLTSHATLADRQQTLAVLKDWSTNRQRQDNAHIDQAMEQAPVKMMNGNPYVAYWAATVYAKAGRHDEAKRLLGVARDNSLKVNDTLLEVTAASFR